MITFIIWGSNIVLLRQKLFTCKDGLQAFTLSLVYFQNVFFMIFAYVYKMYSKSSNRTLFCYKLCYGA